MHLLEPSSSGSSSASSSRSTSPARQNRQAPPPRFNPRNTAPFPIAPYGAPANAGHRPPPPNAFNTPSDGDNSAVSTPRGVAFPLGSRPAVAGYVTGSPSPIRVQPLYGDFAGATRGGPSFAEACDARDACRTHNEQVNPDPDALVNQLDRTVQTVRAWWGDHNPHIRARLESVQEGLDSPYAMADGIPEPLMRELHLLTHQIRQSLPANVDTERLDTLMHAMYQAQREDTPLACRVGIEWVRELMGLYAEVVSHVERHMRSAEGKSDQLNHLDMGDVSAEVLYRDTENTLRDLDYVLQWRPGYDDQESPRFDWVGFTQLLYAHNTLDSVLAAAAGQYTAAVDDLAWLISDMNLPVAEDVLQDLVNEGNVRIHLGSFFTEILNRTPEVDRDDTKDIIMQALRYLQMRPAWDSGTMGADS